MFNSPFRAMILKVLKNHLRKRHSNLKSSLWYNDYLMGLFLNYFQILGSRSTNEDSIKIKTDNLIKEMTIAFHANSAKVMQDVLTAVRNVEPEKHENLIIQ